MNSKILYSTILFALLATACKKTPLPEEAPAEPVFLLSGKLDGTDLNFQAGNINYYMNASYFQDASNLYIFKGELKQNCTSACGYGLTVLINDYKVSEPNGPMNIDSAIHKGAYRLFNESIYPTQQEVNFVPVNELSGDVSYSWSIVNGTSTITAPFTYTLSKTLDIGKTYSVTLTYEENGGTCNATHTNVFRVGNAFQTTITAQKDLTPLTLKFAAKTNTTGTFTYLWEFGDGATSSQSMPSHTYGNEGPFIAKLSMVNAANDSCVSYYQVNAGPNPSCQANFNALFLPLQTIQITRSITILLTDSTGTTYSSAKAMQPTGTHVEITDVGEYKTNNYGQPTKVVSLNFDCVLKNGNVSKLLKGGHAVIAVAYKQ
ncbi:MAG: PKD domain-containing protein [bacterium]|nr:PKD domain-containing protein [bacterium]